MPKTKPPHAPTDAMRQTVQLHATIGTTQEDIARIIGIDAKTLRKHYRDELDLSRAKANATIGGALFNKAKGGDTAAQIFWMKTQAGWKETHRLEGPGENGEHLHKVSPDEAFERLACRLGGPAARTTTGDTETE